MEEVRRRTTEEFGSVPDDDDSRETDVPTGPDPVLIDMWNGRCRRELREARDALREASDRYDAAVLAARTAGLSWGEIGTVLGVAKQQLHRRFRTRQRGRP